MQKKNPKTRCERRCIQKSKEVCRFYNQIQLRYAEALETNENIVEINCNVPLDNLGIGQYSSDFVCKKNDGTYMVRECVWRKQLAWPSVTKLLDASWDYWKKHGVEDWGIVIEKEEEADGKEPTDPNE